MDEPSLEGPRAKHRRGVEQLNVLNDAILEYLGREPKPYSLRGQFHPDRCEYVFVGKILESMEDLAYWGTVLGDVLHNFRCALDHLVCQLVLLNTGRECTGDNQFPICTTGENYWSRGKSGRNTRDWRLQGVADEHKAIIDTLQPYRTHGMRPNQIEVLAGLQKFSNLDKHRLIHPTLFAVDVHDSSDFALISNDDAGDMTGQALDALTTDRETEVLAVRFPCPGPNPDVRVEGELPISVGFGKPPPIRLPAFFTMAEHTEWIIDQFTRFFP